MAVTITKTTNGPYGRIEYFGYEQAYYEIVHNGELIGRLTFQTLTSSGLKTEGEPILAWYISRECAEDAFNLEMASYLLRRPGHIHWRQPPQLLIRSCYEEDFPYGEKTRVLKGFPLYTVVARLAVSEQEPIDAT